MLEFSFQAQVSSLGCVAISFLLGGFVLLLVGVGIILDIKAISIARGRKTTTIGLLMILLGIGSLLFDMVSISKSKAPDREREIVITMAAELSGPVSALFNEAVQRYMETHPNVEIRLLDTPDIAKGRLGWYRQLFKEQSPEVDVYQIDVVWLGGLAEHLVDLYEYGASEVVNEHFPTIIEKNIVDGRLVGIPWYIDVGLLYYRTDLLEKYGYDGPPKTWDALEEMAYTIQEGERAEGNKDFWGFVWQGDAHEILTCNALEWISSNGGGTVIRSDKVITINNDKAVAAIDRVAGWVGTISPLGVTGFQEEQTRNLWQAGNAAFMRNWPYAYFLGNMDGSAIKQKFDVAPLPAGEGGQSVTTLGGRQFAVSKYSKQPAFAADVVFFLASKEEQKLRAIRTEGSFNPTIMDLYQDAEVCEASPFTCQLYGVFTSAVARPSIATAPKYNEVSTLFFQAVHSVLTGEDDAQTALEELELDLENLTGFEVGVP